MTSDLWAREVPRKARKEVTELDIFGLLTLSAMQTQRMRRSFYCPSGLSPITRQSMCKSTSLMSCTQMLGGTMKLSCICATSSLCLRTTLQVVSTSRLVFATWNLILFIFLTKNKNKKIHKFICLQYVREVRYSESLDNEFKKYLDGRQKGKSRKEHMEVCAGALVDEDLLAEAKNTGLCFFPPYIYSFIHYK